jgi:hypothetical protein
MYLDNEELHNSYAASYRCDKKKKGWDWHETSYSTKTENLEGSVQYGYLHTDGRVTLK